MALFYDLRKDQHIQDSVTISDGRGMSACILTFGATLQRLNVPDADGEIRDVVLGYDTTAAYDMQNGYLGAVVGRVANRIKDACYFMNGRRYNLEANKEYGMLHGGPVGFSYKEWDVIRRDSRSVQLRLLSPDGDQGFPGNLKVDVLYTMEERGELTIRYHAETDFDTPVNLTNHSYFNLDGQGGSTVDDHQLMLAARRYTPSDDDLVPTGAVDPVGGTPLDFASFKRLGDVLHLPELSKTKGLDHNFVLSAACEGGAEPAAVLKGAHSGIRMEVLTDRPAIQVYSSGGLSERAGKDGTMYGPFYGICLETQGYPDALHHMNFPSVMLRAGESFDSFTTFRFKTGEE